VIATLRRVLSSALGVGRASEAALPAAVPGRARRRADTARRIDDARRRLKATIPPPED
jgi:hypothetical protein